MADMELTEVQTKAIIEAGLTGLSYEDTLISCDVEDNPEAKKIWLRASIEFKKFILNCQREAAIKGDSRLLINLGKHYLNQGKEEETEEEDISLIFDDAKVT